VEKDRRASNFYTNGDQSITHTFTGVNQFCNEINGVGAQGTGVNTPTQCYLTGERMYRAPTWTLSLDYKFTPDTMVYVTNRRGFKAGSSNPTTVNQDFAMYGPERLTDFEVGIKNQGRISTVPYRFNISAFYGKYSDIQTGDILTFCATAACTGTYTDLVIFNVGKATIKGVEIEAAAKPTASLELNLGYSYQVAKYGAGSVIPQPNNPAAPVGPTNPINFGSGENLEGQNFPGVPRHNLTVAATYNLDFIPTTFANASLNMNYAWRSATDSNQAIGVFSTPSYGTANLRLAFDDLLGSKFSLAFWMSNFMNRAYPLSCANNLQSLSFAACYWGDPRTFGVTGKARFR